MLPTHETNAKHRNNGPHLPAQVFSYVCLLCMYPKCKCVAYIKYLNACSNSKHTKQCTVIPFSSDTCNS